MPRRNNSQLPGKIRQREERKRSNAAGPHKQLRRDEQPPDFADYIDDDLDIFDWLKPDLDLDQ